MATKKTATSTDEARTIAVARDLDALRKVDPMQWRDKILHAFREKKGNAVHAAEFLGIGHRTLVRYMGADATLAGAIEKIRDRARADRKAADA